MCRKIRYLAAFLMVVFSTLAAIKAWAQAPSQALVFGVIAPRSPEQTRANWEPFVKRMGADIRRAMELRVYESQSAMVTAFVGGEVDVAWMGNLPALEVVEAGAGAVFAQMVTKDGSFGYKSVLIVPQASPIRSLKAVLARSRELRFGDGDPKSTSGFLVPLYYAFQKNGVNDTRQIFKSTEAGSHQQNIKKVARGDVDVATANNEELGFFARDYPEQASNVRVVWESPLIPQSPLLWKTTLPPQTKQKIKSFVLGFGASNAEEKKTLLQVNGLSRFRHSSNAQLVPIADLEMYRARRDISNDEALSAQERDRRIDEVVRRGSKLELRLKLIKDF